MTMFEAVKWAKNILINSDTPMLDAEVILCNLLKRDKIYLYSNREVTLKDFEENEFIELIERRKQGEPVSYITGNKEFMGLNFYVKEGVLIPRPDTEILVENLLNDIKDLSKPLIVDVGCGSGAISVSIAKYKEDAKVYALDIADIPLEMTKINATENDVINRVNILKSDILASLPDNLENSVHVIVSNPPYIRDEVIPTLMKDVKDFEPYNALSGGKDGLYFYREITAQSIRFLKKNGIIAYEIGHDQMEEVKNILLSNGFINITCIKDYAGYDRVIIGEKI